MSAPDITVPIRNALLGATAVTQLLPAYLGSYPIFTIRPVPAGAPKPCIVVSQDITLSDNDGINHYQPRIVRDVAVYTHNEDPGVADALLDQLALAIWRLFNRRPQSIAVPGWTVVEVTAALPVGTGGDGDEIAGRAVQVVVTCARRSSLL